MLRRLNATSVAALLGSFHPFRLLWSLAVQQHPRTSSEHSSKISSSSSRPGHFREQQSVNSAVVTACFAVMHLSHRLCDALCERAAQVSISLRCGLQRESQLLTELSRLNKWRLLYLISYQPTDNSTCSDYARGQSGATTVLSSHVTSADCLSAATWQNPSVS